MKRYSFSFAYLYRAIFISFKFYYVSNDSPIFRRFNVQRDGDGVGRASREEGCKAIGGCRASYSQPRIGAPWHQARQYPRVQKWLLADQVVRFWWNKASEHCGATTQRVAAVFAARGIADRHWRNVQVIIRLNHYHQLIQYFTPFIYVIAFFFFYIDPWFHNFESSKKLFIFLFFKWQFIQGIKKYVNQFWRI